jgi:hypothetical protein
VPRVFSFEKNEGIEGLKLENKMKYIWSEGEKKINRKKGGVLNRKKDD